MLAIKSENKLLEARMIAAYEFLHNRGIEEDEIFEILPRIFELTSSPILNTKDSSNDNKTTRSTRHIQTTKVNSSNISEAMVKHVVHRRNDGKLAATDAV